MLWMKMKRKRSPLKVFKSSTSLENGKLLIISLRYLRNYWISIIERRFLSFIKASLNSWRKEKHCYNLNGFGNLGLRIENKLGRNGRERLSMKVLKILPFWRLEAICPFRLDTGVKVNNCTSTMRKQFPCLIETFPELKRKEKDWYNLNGSWNLVLRIENKLEEMEGNNNQWRLKFYDFREWKILMLFVWILV